MTLISGEDRKEEPLTLCHISKQNMRYFFSLSLSLSLNLPIWFFFLPLPQQTSFLLCFHKRISNQMASLVYTTFQFQPLDCNLCI